MNIHFIMGEKVTAQQARARGLSIRSSKGTQPARTRSGQSYPGGKGLRRAYAELHRRVDGVQPGSCKRPDRISSRDDTPPWGSFGFSKPGSMKA